ncbi:MAG TPA: glutamate formimidoyltransferase [Atribacteraceae bacterium]|nr:glutamate formimidoyltransferase [Atribacteraceae bacterium]
MPEIIQCPINLSTSDLGLLQELVGRLKTIPGLLVADASADPDHNRSVISLLGGQESLWQAVEAIFEMAERTIAITRHAGEHPRIGAIDVVPFVPWRRVSMEQCIELARRIGEALAGRFQVPVYLYGEAAWLDSRRDLSNLRKGGYERLREEIGTIPERFPDFGPRETHRTLGAVAVGARGPLIAFNVNLKTDSIDIASRIARRLRGESGGLNAVKAIGIRLTHRGMTQVAMNMLDFRRSTLYQAYELIKLECRRFGVEVAGAEIVGLVPLEALVDLAGLVLGIPDLRMEQVLEYHFIDFS